MLTAMATRATTSEDFRFIVDVRPSRYSTDRNRLDAVIYVVYLEDGKIRNCSWSSLADPGAEYADLRIEGWIDKDSRDDKDFYYGHEPLEYREVYSIDQRRAESMAKTLRRLNKKIETLTNKYGRPTDFAGFLSYLAQAMGVNPRNAFARKVSGRGWSYDDGEYRWMDVDGLRHHLSEKIREWRGEG